MLCSTPRILFVLNRVLGWKSYAADLARVVEGRSDVRAEVLFIEPGRTQRMLMRHHRATGLKRLVKRIDPITAYQGVFGRQIRREIARFEPDLIHFGSHWPAAAGLSQTRRGRTPFTVALDSTFPSMARALGAPRLWTDREREREGDLLRQAERLYPWSHWAGASARDDYGVDGGRVRVIPPSIAVDGPMRVPGGHGPLKVLFIGNDFLRKGGDRLHRWVRDRLSDVCELHVVSGDPRAAALDGRNVICHGSVPNHRLRTELVPEMDVLCHPTRSDMSAYVVVEAAAAGLPVVASAVGGIPDLVQPGKTGFLVEPDDEDGFVSALRELSTSRARIDQMSQAARAFAEARFDARTNYGVMLDELVALVGVRA